MNTISSKPSLNGEQFQLGELLSTNKSLAQQKRQVHRQKLRQYSEKAVKLKDILRNSIDHSQRKCLQNKLKAIQQKQDAEISKLAKIDQIQQQIDEYMYEENEDGSIRQIKNEAFKQPGTGNNIQDYSYQFNNQNTPAKKLKTKQPCFSKQINNGDENDHLQCSIKSNLFNSSGQFRAKQRSDKKYTALNTLNQNQMRIKQEGKQKAKDSRVYSCWQPSNIPKNNYGEPKASKMPTNTLFAYTIQDKSYPRDSKFVNQYSLRQQEQKISNLKITQKKQEERLAYLQKRISQLVQKQRNLMERIDGFERQQSILVKKSSSFINSINRSKDIIISSGLLLQQLSEIENVGKAKEKTSHQFSIDSLQSHANSDGYLGLSLQLANFEQLLEQFLLSAERVVMLTSGELQQCGLKINRFREECNSLQLKKRALQNETNRYQQSIPQRKKECRALEQEFKRLKYQAAQLEQIGDIKKKLVSQLEQKCQKLKQKKKNLGEKLLKGQRQLQIIQCQFEKRLASLKQVEQDILKCMAQHKQLEEMMIFAERRFQKAKSEQMQSQKKRNNIQNRTNEARISHEQMLIEINQKQNRLLQIQVEIQNQISQQNISAQKIRKVQKQLHQSTQTLNQQKSIINSQNEQINLKSNELLQLQKKIISIADSMKAIEAQNYKLQESISNKTKVIQKLRIQEEQTRQAKEQLQEILREVISKKENLLSQVQHRSNQLQILLTDLMEGNDQLTATNQQYSALQLNIKLMHEQCQSSANRLQQLKDELQEMMEQESNILGRINKLQHAEKQMLLQIGLKGGGNKVDEQLRQKIAQAISDMNTIKDLKSQLKQCKYENRKLKLDNKRLSKLIEMQPDNREQY